MRAPLARNISWFEMLVRPPLADLLLPIAESVRLRLPEVSTLRFKARQLAEVDTCVSNFLESLPASAPHPIMRFSPEFRNPAVSESGARNFVVSTRRGFWHGGGFPSSQVYSRQERCPACGTGARQIGALVLPTTYVPKVHAIWTTLSNELLLKTEKIADWIEGGFLTGTISPVLSGSSRCVEQAAGVPLPEVAETVTAELPGRMTEVEDVWSQMCDRYSPKLRVRRGICQWIPAEANLVDLRRTLYGRTLSPWAQPDATPACDVCGRHLGWYRMSSMSLRGGGMRGARMCQGLIGGDSGHCRSSQELVCDESTLAKLPPDILRHLRLEQCEA